MSTFDSTKTQLGKLLDDVVEGRIQLPDFQRGWVWDDDHIRSLLVSIARSFPIGAIMLLETGGEAKFQVRPVEGVELPTRDSAGLAENLILDGQQRLTSLTQVLRLKKPVATRDDKKGNSSSTTTSTSRRRSAGPRPSTRRSLSSIRSALYGLTSAARLSSTYPRPSARSPSSTYRVTRPSTQARGNTRS